MRGPAARPVDGASTSIHFAIYGLRGQDEVLAALVRAQARGVIVKGVVDADIQGRNYYADTPRLLKALANFRTDQAADRRSLAAQRPSSTRARCARPADREGPLSCFSATVGGVKYELAQASEDPIEFEGDIMPPGSFFLPIQWPRCGQPQETHTMMISTLSTTLRTAPLPYLTRSLNQQFHFPTPPRPRSSRVTGNGGSR